MKKIFLGIILGIGAVIPGVCTASLAIFLGIYEILINFFSGKVCKKNIIDVMLISIGVIIGIVVVCLVIDNLDSMQKNLLTFFFYGFMLYGIKQYEQQNIKSNFKLSFFVYGFISIILFQLVFSFLKIDISYSITGIFLIGILVGIALVLPGLSGSMILMSFGVYYKIIEYALEYLVKFKINYHFFFILSFLFGLLVGVVISSVIIKKIINQDSLSFSNYIFGMIIGTIFVMTGIFFDIILTEYALLVIIMGSLGYLLNRTIMKII